MKYRLLIFIIGFLILNIKAKSQCVFNPTVLPANLTLCPNTSDTLWTQVYDTYQWYKNGNIIVGETKQYLVVDDFNYSLAMVSVNATLSGCTEMSPEVLVDGLVFLLPTVQTSGNYTYNGSEHLVCIGDTISFNLSLPYDTNIEWTKNGSPISSATTALLNLTSSVITSTDDYHVCGSPSICPNYGQCLGVNLPVRFISCVTGVSENQQGSLVSIYPNPSAGKITIELAKTANGAIEIYDQLGKNIYSMPYSNQQTSNEIDLSKFPKGIYFVKIYDGQTVLAKKIVIQ